MTQYQVAGSLISSREAAIRAAIESWAGDTSASEWTEDQIREYLPGWCKAPEGVDQAELDAEVVQTAIAMMHAAATIPADLIKALPHGVSVEDCIITTVAALDAEYYIDFDIDAVRGHAPALLLPGWFANDGHAEIYIPDADSGEGAARQYVDTGNWGERHRTEWIDVWAWRRALALGEDGRVVTIEMERDRHTIALDPEEPPCTHDEHDWREWRVRGHGGGVEITQVCAHCGHYLIHDTWAQRRDTGEQGLEAVEYRDPDDASRAWVESLRGEGDDE